MVERENRTAPSMARDPHPDAPHSTIFLAGSEFDQHRRALLRYLLRRVKEEDANDLLQEVFLRALSIRRETLVQNPQAYLYGIAAHVVTDFIRRSRKNLVQFDSELLDAMGADADMPTEGHADGLSFEHQVRQALAQLPATHLRVLVAERRDGLTVPEIASKYGLSVHTVKKYLVQALVHVRASFAND